MHFIKRFLSGYTLHFARYDQQGYDGGPGMSQRGRAGSGCNPRLIMAALVIGYAVFSYFFMTHEYENPYTGRKQRLAMGSAAEEVAMGLQSAPGMIREFGGEHPNPQAQALVDQIGMKLVNATDVKGSEYKWDFHLLNDSKTINAFALPGGQIFITMALFTALEDEEQLAGVLGHEIGHVVGRHSNQQMAKSGFIQQLFQGIGMLIGGDTGAGGINAAQMVGQMLTMKYGRDDELESDRLAVKYMIECGMNPEKMIGVMEILKKAGGGGGKSEIMSTHPDPGNRIDHIKEEIAKYRAGKR
jgi:predicted Zn-dependent protease